jgi:mannose-6-phosphate isomerase-like protein (cupin superfamily)
LKTAIRLIVAVGIFAAGYVSGETRHWTASAAATIEPAPAIIHAKALFEGLQPVPGLPGVGAKVLYQSSIGAVNVDTVASTVKLHKHLMQLEFLYVVSGGGSGRVGSSKGRIGPGDLIVIPKGTPHSFVADPGGFKVLEFDSPPGPDNDIYWLH